MADEDNGAAVLIDAAIHLGKTFLLKAGIAHGENLIDDKNIGIEMRSDSECEPDIHSRRVTLDRSIDKLADNGKIHDLIERTMRLRFSYTVKSCFRLYFL